MFSFIIRIHQFIKGSVQGRRRNRQKGCTIRNPIISKTTCSYWATTLNQTPWNTRETRTLLRRRTTVCRLHRARLWCHWSQNFIWMLAVCRTSLKKLKRETMMCSLTLKCRFKWLIRWPRCRSSSRYHLRVYSINRKMLWTRVRSCLMNLLRTDYQKLTTSWPRQTCRLTRIGSFSIKDARQTWAPIPSSRYWRHTTLGWHKSSFCSILAHRPISLRTASIS